MKFADYLCEDLIFLDACFSSKEEAIEYLTGELCRYYNLNHHKEMLNDICKRENLKSTGLGKRLALPHGRTDLADKLYIVFARCDNGVDWRSIDGLPVNFVFLIVGPARLETEYLQVLGDISRIMIRHEVVESLRKARNAKEIIKIIKDSGIRKGNRKNEG